MLEPDGGAYAGVIEARSATASSATTAHIDRGALAAVVFGGDGRLDELEAISHPAINARARFRDVAVAPRRWHVVLDMAVLTESRLGWAGDQRLYHRVVVVEAPDRSAHRTPRRPRRGRGRCSGPDRSAGHPMPSAACSPTSVDHQRRRPRGSCEAEVDRLAHHSQAWEAQELR